ncbi:alpha/beta hydrolase [Amycolatopsis sp. NEAU-NG30]|uniref:Alpha/beta hydrolase n=1 Tax=Amycolatopsis melonis TaxID=3156488 RepID=A0ABV0L5Y3_9PSEU
MGKPDEYFPFELDHDPAVFGLVRAHRDGPFGRLHYLHSPDPSGGTVTVFLHGVANDWTTWTPILRVARKRGDDLGELLLVDLPGFGASENTKDHLDMGQVGDLVLDVAAELGYRSVRLAGHSMGGFLALDMAGRNPGVVTSVHLVAGAYFSVIRTVQNPWTSLVRRPRVAAAYFSQSALATLGPAGLRGMALLRRARLLPLTLRGFLAYPWRANRTFLDRLTVGMRPRSFLLAAQNGADYRPEVRWRRIRCPLVAVFGVKDKLVPVADMVDLRRVCEHAETHLLDSCAHFPHVEMPERTYAFLFGGTAR